MEGEKMSPKEKTGIEVILAVTYERVRAGNHAPRCFRVLHVLHKLVQHRADDVSDVLRAVLNFRELMIPAHNEELAVPIIIQALNEIRIVVIVVADEADFCKILELLRHGLVSVPSILDRFYRVLHSEKGFMCYGVSYPTPTRFFSVKGTSHLCPVLEFHGVKTQAGIAKNVA